MMKAWHITNKHPSIDNTILLMYKENQEPNKMKMGKTRPLSPQTINIRATIEVNGLNQRKLADILGIHTHAVNRWCRNHNISTGYQEKIKKTLHRNNMIIVKKEYNTIDNNISPVVPLETSSQQVQPIGDTDITKAGTPEVENKDATLPIKEEGNAPIIPNHMLEKKCKCSGRMAQTEIEVDPTCPEQVDTPQMVWIWMCTDCGIQEPIY